MKKIIAITSILFLSSSSSLSMIIHRNTPFRANVATRSNTRIAFSPTDAYPDRAKELNFTPKERLKELIMGSDNIDDSGKNVYFLDVRSNGEIASKPFTKNNEYQCVSASCTKDDVSMLMSKAKDILPDKLASIIVFCASGMRANSAKLALERLGYTNVYNAGGIDDLDFF